LVVGEGSFRRWRRRLHLSEETETSVVGESSSFGHHRGRIQSSEEAETLVVVVGGGVVCRQRQLRLSEAAASFAGRGGFIRWRIWLQLLEEPATGIVLLALPNVATSYREFAAVLSAFLARFSELTSSNRGTEE